MEGKKQLGLSSSFQSDLFGTNESSSSKGIFGSVFPPASKMVGRDSSQSELFRTLSKEDSVKDVWNNKHGSAPDSSNGQGRELGNNYKSSIPPNKDSSSNIFQDESMRPCYLSSSLYYGGQDIYSNSSTTYPSSGSTPVYKQDGGDDTNENNLDSASRGNWWQGSLYY